MEIIVFALIAAVAVLAVVGVGWYVVAAEQAKQDAADATKVREEAERVLREKYAVYAAKRAHVAETRADNFRASSRLEGIKPKVVVETRTRTSVSRHQDEFDSYPDYTIPLAMLIDTPEPSRYSDNSWTDTSSRSSSRDDSWSGSSSSSSSSSDYSSSDSSSSSSSYD